MSDLEALARACYRLRARGVPHEFALDVFRKGNPELVHQMSGIAKSELDALVTEWRQRQPQPATTTPANTGAASILEDE